MWTRSTGGFGFPLLRTNEAHNGAFSVGGQTIYYAKREQGDAAVVAALPSHAFGATHFESTRSLERRRIIGDGTSAFYVRAEPDWSSTILRVR